jgi:hypothetical protein
MQFAWSDSGSMHALLQHIWPPLQTCPQAPQLFTSVVVSAQDVLQQVFAVDGHVMPHPVQFISSELSSTQLPLQHALPAPQPWPHVPQFVPLDCRSMPSSTEPSQSSSR